MSTAWGRNKKQADQVQRQILSATVSCNFMARLVSDLLVLGSCRMVCYILRAWD